MNLIFLVSNVIFFSLIQKQSLRISKQNFPILRSKLLKVIKLDLEKMGNLMFLFLDIYFQFLKLSNQIKIAFLVYKISENRINTSSKRWNMLVTYIDIHNVSNQPNFNCQLSMKFCNRY